MVYGLNYLKSVEFDLSYEVGLYGFDRALERANPDNPYIMEWFERRRKFIAVTNMLALEIQMFNEKIERDYASLLPTARAVVSYTIPSHAREMEREGWTPNE